MMAEVDRSRQGEGVTAGVVLPEEMRGIPRREVIEALPVMDRVICASFGLRQDGHRPFYPSTDDVVGGAFRDWVYVSSKNQIPSNLKRARRQLAKSMKRSLGDLDVFRRNPEGLTETQREGAERFEAYLADQGYVDDISIDTLSDIAIRRISKKRFGLVVKPREVEVENADLAARGYQLMTGRGKYHMPDSPGNS